MASESNKRGSFKFLAVTSLLNIAWLVLRASAETPEVATTKSRIALALIISVVGSWPRKVQWLWISCVALMWIVLEYIWWWIRSSGAVNAFGTSFSYTSHFAYLLQGTWWDLLVLCATVVGLVWAGNNLIHAFYQSRDSISDADAQEK